MVEIQDLQKTAFAGEQNKHKVSMMPIEVTPGTPPNMRMHKRWDYMEEYIDFWKRGVTSKLKAIGFVTFGILTLETFPPGALLMFALAARHQDLAWLYDFIVKKFGRQRTIVLVD